MELSFIILMDIIGTIAFAVSGAMTAANCRMDLFGINILAVITATGGGMLRDLVIGNTPPVMFRHPRYVIIAILTANLFFLILRFHKAMPGRLIAIYEKLFFLFDTLGLAAFTVDGVFMGIASGYANNLFLITFLGVVTGVGGGIFRDILANRIPDVLTKHVYAVASITGAIVTAVAWRFHLRETVSVLSGFITIILLRLLAVHYKWNLPRIS